MQFSFQVENMYTMMNYKKKIVPADKETICKSHLSLAF